MRFELFSIARSFRTRPGPLLVAVACLALGLGANVVVFGVVDALLLRPPVGVSDPETLVRVRVGGATTPLGRGVGPTASYPQFGTIREQRADVLSGLAAYGSIQATRGRGSDAQPLRVQAVTGDYFTVLGIRPALGRFFDDADGEGRAASPVAVLSYHAWERTWGADPSVPGGTVDVNGVPMTVIGVAPKGLRGGGSRRPRPLDSHRDDGRARTGR